MAFFGGKDPFDHPFFSRTFDGLFGAKNPFDDPFFTSNFGSNWGPRKQISIEEVNSDDDDGVNDVKSKPNKELSLKDSNEHPSGYQSFSFQSVAYGGSDGIYYTSSVGKRTGGDGVFLMEMKEEDRIVGESLHTLSKGMHDKGHSVTTKQSKDGRVDSLQTLHNLEEDELSGFKENWKTNAEKVFPQWSNDFNLLENAGANNSAWDDFAGWSGWSGWPFQPLEYYGNGGAQPEPGNGSPKPSSSRGTSRRSVPVE